MTGSRVSTVLWAMISREDDPRRVDWGALFCLVAYSALGMGFVGMIAYFMIRLAIEGLDGLGGR